MLIMKTLHVQIYYMLGCYGNVEKQIGENTLKEIFRIYLLIRLEVCVEVFRWVRATEIFFIILTHVMATISIMATQGPLVY